MEATDQKLRITIPLSVEKQKNQKPANNLKIFCKYFSQVSSCLLLMKAIIRRKPKALFHIVGSQLSSQLLFYSTHAQADKHDLLPKQHHSSF